MKGHGWECDECGARELVDGDPFVEPRRMPPEGWLVVLGPVPGSPVFAATAEHHYCGDSCAVVAIGRRALGADGVACQVSP